jgi:hypothetical protein
MMSYYMPKVLETKLCSQPVIYKSLVAFPLIYFHYKQNKLAIIIIMAFVLLSKISRLRCVLFVYIDIIISGYYMSNSG